jgi:hypothetical protein
LFCIFYWLFFLSISSFNICLIKNFDSLFFSGLLSMGSPRSHDTGYKSERLAQVDFNIFLKYFFQLFFLPVFFFFGSLFIGLSQFYILNQVFNLLTRLVVRFVWGFFISFHYISRCPLLIFCWRVRPCVIVFVVWVYSVSFICIYHLNHGFLEWIYLLFI